MKKNLLLLILTILSYNLNAQSLFDGGFKRFSADVSFGVPVFNGDIKNKLFGYDIALRLNWNLTPTFSAGPEFAIGSVKGVDETGEFFTNNYIKALGGVDVYVFNLFKFNQLSKVFQPYLGFNVGAIKSNIVESEIDQHYKGWAWASQLNIGFKYKVNDILDLNLHANFLFAKTDSLDNHRPYFNANDYNDALSTYRIGFTIHLGKGKESIIWKENKDIFSPNNALDDSLRLFNTKRINELEAKLIALENKKTYEPTKNEVVANNFYKAGIIVYFEENLDEIPDIETHKLINLAKYLLANPNAQLFAKGYTAKDGNHQINLKASKLSANKIKNYLVDLGISAKRISDYGFGGEHNLPDSEFGNKRVLLTVR